MSEALDGAALPVHQVGVAETLGQTFSSSQETSDTTTLSARTKAGD